MTDEHATPDQIAEMRRICNAAALWYLGRFSDTDLERAIGYALADKYAYRIGRTAAAERAISAALATPFAAIETGRPKERNMSHSRFGFNKPILDSASYLCHECAERHGGVWPDGHCATQHFGVCDVCGEERALASVGDYDWPDGKRRGMRD
jgi:hypothetical protein